MQSLCPASMIGIVSCGGEGVRDWCDVKTPNGPKAKYLPWHGGEGASPKQVASGGQDLNMGEKWFDAGRGDVRSARTTCCELGP